MTARVPLLVHAPARFVPCRIGASVSAMDLLSTLIELASGQVDPRLSPEGRSLPPYLRDGSGHDEVIGEYTAEGTPSLLMMIRCGDYKFIYSEQDPCLLYDLRDDPQERENLAVSPAHRGTSEVFLGEARRHQDIPAIIRIVLDSQRRRRLATTAPARGRLASRDHQSWVDASRQYMCNHIDLGDLERRARFP